MYIPKQKAKLVKFIGFDGKTYGAVTAGIKNNILTVFYKVPSLNEMATTYLEKKDWGRISKR